MCRGVGMDEMTMQKKNYRNVSVIFLLFAVGNIK